MPDSAIVNDVETAIGFAEQIGYPVIVRPAFTLGGTGGGIGRTDATSCATSWQGGLTASPIRQVLVERSLIGWKEIEYEVMRDGADTCITVCNMENFDPMGVHTGDSIVVAPSQTLSDHEYQMLRTAALKIIRALGIEGGCNIQFALDPNSHDYSVIEVNPRVSRSSALASKATGYPIARVAAKIAIGKRLDEIPNAVTGTDHGRLRAGARLLRGQDPALAVRQVRAGGPHHRHPDEGDRRGDGDRPLVRGRAAEGGALAGDRRPQPCSGRSASWSDADGQPTEQLFELIARPNDLRLWAVDGGAAPGRRRRARSAELSGIDPWFLHKLADIVAHGARAAAASR